jgi:4-hydroxybenzoate polyprenyltransferase
MATPALSALLWLGAFPPLKVIALGLVTAFAGYTAVYALNDVIDYRIDKEKIQQGGLGKLDDYLDAVMVRHPIAQGLLSLREGLVWVVVWAFLALIGAYLLNPVCVLIFMAGCVLEIVYCLMLRISLLRTIISGAVKTPNPSPSFLIILFLWLFFWEIGGQNIPNDWIDIDEDRQLRAKTIPVKFGPYNATRIIFASLSLAIASNVFLFWVTPTRFEIYYVAACFLAGVSLLLIPAYRLFKTKARLQAMTLFNRASYYPMVLLVVVTIKSIL